jgi:hypothetical protein
LALSHHPAPFYKLLFFLASFTYLVFYQTWATQCGKMSQGKNRTQGQGGDGVFQPIIAMVEKRSLDAVG